MSTSGYDTERGVSKNEESLEKSKNTENRSKDVFFFLVGEEDIYFEVSLIFDR